MASELSTLPGCDGAVFVPHRRPGPFEPARFVIRPDRFTGVVRLPDGREVEAYIADRGRLAGILYPGAPVFLVRNSKPFYRHAFQIVLARGVAAAGQGEGPLISLDPAYANELAHALLTRRLIPGLRHAQQVVREVRVGASRFDFALRVSRARRLLVEVKSAAASDGQAALFPDAPSERAVRHVEELTALRRAGHPAAVLFVAQRADVIEIRPHPVDPRFAFALANARRAGVKLLGVAFTTTLEGFHYAGPRPVRDQI
jgi:sugar fermentation stimulation protein A